MAERLPFAAARAAQMPATTQSSKAPHPFWRIHASASDADPACSELCAIQVTRSKAHTWAGRLRARTAAMTCNEHSIRDILTDNEAAMLQGTFVPG